MKQKPYASKTWLENERYTKRKSVETIAKECNVSYNTIVNALKRFNLK